MLPPAGFPFSRHAGGLLKEETMSAAYLIAQLKVTNSENYKEYIEKVPEIVKKYGGEYLARGGE